MLDILFILENKDIVSKAVKDKNGGDVDFEKIENLYNSRKELAKSIGEINQQRKSVAEKRDVESGKELKQKLTKLEDEMRSVTKDLNMIISKIPNVPSPDTPVGKDESENVVLRKVGEVPQFDFKAKAHWDIGKERDFIDIERATKIAGSRFCFLKGDLVKLQFAIVQWVFDVVTDEDTLKEIIETNKLSVPSKPFVPVVPPVMISPEMFFGMARLDPREDKYFIENDELFLIGSAEHSLGSMHSGEAFEEDVLPLRYIGYSTAFRREAGSYGKDTKGILRQHQFDKLEFECFSVGEKSRNEQDFLVAIQEYLMQKLGLPYQVVSVCTGDMGGPDIRQLDIETWMPGQGVYRETHSSDLIGEYQSRRLGIKVKRNSGENEFVHMNDATVFAIGRILIAIIENYQKEDGKITVPEVLSKYLGNIKEI